MTGENAKSLDATAREVYRRARDQMALRTNYDVQAGLARLNEQMLGGERDSFPPVHADSTGQAALFDLDELDVDDTIGYRGPATCAAAGITYRQLDYWARTGLVEPSVRSAHGAGSARLYSFRDILVLKVVKRLLDTGISLQQIRAAVSHLRNRGTDDLAQVTLMSDGVSVYECTSSDEVVDLLQGGQGVFGIALGSIWQEIGNTLGEMPSESKTDSKPGTRTTSRQRGRSETIAREKASSA
jgi:DNA-binding transcriptional MerR regulator